MHWLNDGIVMQRTGNRVPEACPHNTYPCRGDDRWCAIAVSTDAHWAGLCRVLRDQPWTRDERFLTLLGRKESEAELDELVGQWTRLHTAEDVEARLQAAGVPASVVETSQDTRQDPQLRHRQFFRTLHHEAIGEHTYRGPAFRLSATPDSQSAGATMGQHNIDVCLMLGLTDDEIDKALVDGSLGTAPEV